MVSRGPCRECTYIYNNNKQHKTSRFRMEQLEKCHWKRTWRKSNLRSLEQIFTEELQGDMDPQMHAEKAKWGVPCCPPPSRKGRGAAAHRAPRCCLGEPLPCHSNPECSSSRSASGSSSGFGKTTELAHGVDLLLNLLKCCFFMLL